MPGRRPPPPCPLPAREPWHPWPPLPRPNHTDSEDEEWIAFNDSGVANTEELGGGSSDAKSEEPEMPWMPLEQRVINRYVRDEHRRALPRPSPPHGSAYRATGDPYRWDVFRHVFLSEHLRLQQLDDVHMRLLLASRRYPGDVDLRASRDRAKEEAETQLARYNSLFDLWGVARGPPLPRCLERVFV